MIKELLIRIITPEVISVIILAVVLYYTVRTFDFSQRPYVGVIKTEPTWTDSDLHLKFKLINSGNVPAVDVKTNVKITINNVITSDVKGTSEFILFPNQFTFGTQIIHNLDKNQIDKYDIQIEVLITYKRHSKPFKKKYVTFQHFKFDSKGTSIIDGYL